MIPASSDLEAIRMMSSSFEVDEDTSTLRVRPGFSSEQAETVTEFFIQRISELRSAQRYMSYNDKRKLVSAASSHLSAVVALHKAQLDKGLSSCQKNKMLMSISKLDRLIAAEGAPYSIKALSREDLRARYQTKVSKDIATKWLDETTHAGRKGAARGQALLCNSNKAPIACLLHPEEIDFFNDTFTHKQMARLNDHVEIDPESHHHKILYNGVKTNVSIIAQDLKVVKRGSLYSQDESRRYFYCQKRGVTEFDPCRWSELPVFRQRKHARSNDDYRLVIKTIINDRDDDKHTWLELKSPTSVYNVGYFWDEQDQISPPFIAKSLRGMLFSVDKNELLGKENNIKKTVCTITKEQFELLKSQIETFQNSPDQKMFNLVNSNCTTWVQNIVSAVGVDISSKQNIAGVMTGRSSSNFFEDGSLGSKVEQFFQSFIAFFRNLIVLCMGGSSSTIPRSQFDINALPIRNVADMFDTERTLFDYPKRVRLWQDAVERSRAERESLMKESDAYKAMSKKKQKEELFKVRTALPVDVALPKVSRLF